MWSHLWKQFFDVEDKSFYLLSASSSGVCRGPVTGGVLISICSTWWDPFSFQGLDSCWKWSKLEVVQAWGQGLSRSLGTYCIVKHCKKYPPLLSLWKMSIVLGRQISVSGMASTVFLILVINYQFSWTVCDMSNLGVQVIYHLPTHTKHIAIADSGYWAMIPVNGYQFPLSLIPRLCGLRMPLQGNCGSTSPSWGHITRSYNWAL